MSGSKAQLRSQALARRVHTLRAEGISVRETAQLCGVHKAQVRKLQLLGERIKTIDLLDQQAAVIRDEEHDRILSTDLK